MTDTEGRKAMDLVLRRGKYNPYGEVDEDWAAARAYLAKLEAEVAALRKFYRRAVGEA